MDNILKGVETILFCDESKFDLNDHDHEDAIYYFAVAVEKVKVPIIHKEFNNLLLKHRVQTKRYHSTDIFKKIRPRVALMDDLSEIIIRNRLLCFCYKYDKSLLFEPTKQLQKLGDNIINFESPEHQALFYFLMELNTYLKDKNPLLLKKEISMYFDRGVYGVDDIQAFNFPNELFILNQMTHVEKSLISLLFLPDFFGYIFRKSKKSQNKVQFGDKSIESSLLTINSYKCLVNITTAKLFKFINLT